MRKYRLLPAFLLLILFFELQAQPPQGYKWTRDGNGYFTIEGGQITKNELPSLAKTVIVSKTLLKPKNDTASLSIRNFFFSNDDKKILIYTNTKKVWRDDTRGDYWLLNLADNSLRQIGKTRPASSLMFAKFSPDGRKVAYVSEYNLFVEDLLSGKATQLSMGGNRKLINGTFDWVYEEEFGCQDGFRWSPDSKKIAYWQIDIYGSHTITLQIDGAVVHVPVVVRQWEEHPGDVLQTIFTRMVDLEVLLHLLQHLPVGRELVVGNDGEGALE